MIARLRGVVVARRADRVVLDVGGVGYDVAVPLSTLTVLPAVGGEATLHVHTHVGDDVLALYGFHTETEKQVFELLLSVSGVGRATALALLSGIPVRELLAALVKGDARRLSEVRGVGKKTAERLVLELREKVEKLEIGVSIDAALTPARPPAAGAASDVVAALVKLGYRAQEAEAMVARAAAGLDAAGDPGGKDDVARLLREALRRGQL